MTNWQAFIDDINLKISSLQIELKKLLKQRRQRKKNIDWEVKYKKI